LFDAIEFSESIATTDVLYDLAFALMDLWKRDLRLEANLLLNRYLWRSENMTEELAGLAALPLFMSLRASVLAKVAAIRFRDVDRKPATRTEAIRYFAAARELLQPANPILVAVGGLSGSGKTALSTRIAPFVGRPPGAVHLRSDIERKRMLGAGELERLPAEGYAPDATARVFANLRTMAEATLDAGHGVVVDAVHRTPEERSLLRAVAEKTGARFVGLWLDAPLPVLVARVGARMGDASDATAEIVRAQAAEPVGTLDWERIDAVGPIDAVAAAARIIVARDA
jgi:predicted kinase